jgi:hypothetical protein
MRFESIRTSGSTVRYSNGCSKGAQRAVKRRRVILSHRTVSSAASSVFKVKVRRDQVSRRRYDTSMESGTKVECVTTVVSPPLLGEIPNKVARTATYT